MKYRIKFRLRVVMLLFVVFAISNISAAPEITPGFQSGDVIDNTDSYHTIKGKVTDKNNNMELVFASVSAVGTNIGTVTNTEGEFTLKIDKKLNVSKIAFSSLGYKNKTISLSNLLGKFNKIEMESNAVPLEEVTVRPGNPYELIKAILDKIPDNYSTEANSLMAFYRETVMQKRKYVSISEAVVEIYKAPYNKYKNDQIRIFKGRKSSDVKKQDTLFLKLQGGPNTTLLLDVIKNPYILISEESIHNYYYEITEILNVNDQLNYVISFTQKENIDYPLYNGKMYVDINKLAITAIEFSLNLNNPEQASKMFVKKKPFSMKLIPTNTKYLVKYKEDNGKFFFNYARGEVQFKCKWKKKLFNSKYTVMSEMAVTDRTNQNVVEFKRSERLKSNEIIADKVTAFTDNNFWGKLNLIEPEQSIQNAIKKYGKRLKRNSN